MNAGARAPPEVGRAPPGSTIRETGSAGRSVLLVLPLAWRLAAGGHPPISCKGDPLPSQQLTAEGPPSPIADLVLPPPPQTREAPVAHGSSSLLLVVYGLKQPFW